MSPAQTALAILHLADASIFEDIQEDWKRLELQMQNPTDEENVARELMRCAEEDKARELMRRIQRGWTATKST
jgi:hypothetical protein